MEIKNREIRQVTGVGGQGQWRARPDLPTDVERKGQLQRILHRAWGFYVWGRTGGEKWAKNQEWNPMSKWLDKPSVECFFFLSHTCPACSTSDITF